jgi:hypothetical protein
MRHTVFNYNHLCAMNALDQLLGAFLLFEMLLDFISFAFEPTLEGAL